MQIRFNIPDFTRNERNSHCDVLHITPVRVARLVLDDAIAAIQTLRERHIILRSFVFISSFMAESSVMYNRNVLIRRSIGGPTFAAAG